MYQTLVLLVFLKPITSKCDVSLQNCYLQTTLNNNDGSVDHILTCKPEQFKKRLISSNQLQNKNSIKLKSNGMLNDDEIKFRNIDLLNYKKYFVRTKSSF